MKTRNYKGFELDWVEEKQEFAISLEGEQISHVPTIGIGEKCIDFFHEASTVSFSLHRKRAEKARQAERDNAGPEPELAKQGKPNVPWVKWYRAVSGCALLEAYEEAVRRIAHA
ncbi:hypothetical protein Q094_06952 [Pseudomonas aeruginosa PS42]|uniref:hypothetical protein n=1 Tax=Pseudomonas aeruginosa TaxID=287 RepID=UPI00044AD45B|nr:hypothetical protein [Pseudomonas aeruginosa]ETU71942.1 hypothetical protein Q094_06952 [Pseudomonas aeruginosa PS42]